MLVRLVCSAVILSWVISYGIERWNIFTFVSGGSSAGSAVFYSTPLFSRKDCAAVNDQQGAPNAVSRNQGVLCECPDPVRTGELEVRSRVSQDGTVEYLCVSGWYKKVIRVGDV